jgi:hypothetical protein
MNVTLNTITINKKILGIMPPHPSKIHAIKV